MGKKTLEIAAVAASIAANCVPCTSLHVAKARELGVSEEDITEALELAKLVKDRAGGFAEAAVNSKANPREKKPCCD